MKITRPLSFSSFSGLISGIFMVVGIFFQANAQTQPNPFARLLSSDETNRNFEADLTQLSSFFEKAYFLDLIYKDSVVVVQNSSLKNNFMPLLCNNKIDNEKVLLHIEEIRAKVVRVAGSMSESEKAIIVKKYEKYR